MARNDLTMDKKTAVQLDREIAEELARRYPGSPVTSAIVVGQRFDYFGQVFEIVKIGRSKERTIHLARRVKDPFGKELLIDQRSFPARDFARQHLRPIA